MKFYNVKFTLEVNGETLKDENGNAIISEFETPLRKTTQECLNEAHEYCMIFCKKFKESSGIDAQYNWTEVKEVK